ncbi:transposase [Horticoccus sp. 23ND18S-11]
MYPRRFDQRRPASEDVTRAGVCRHCPLAAQCTRGKQGRTLMRHHRQELIDRAIAQGLSSEAFASRNRRRHLMEGSFADAANQHHFKRARWRRIWRQQIQDWLIAACQNIRLFLRRGDRGRPAGAGVVTPPGAGALALFIFYLLPQPLD